MSIDLSQLATAVLPAVAASWVVYRLGLRQRRRDRACGRREVAAAELMTPLSEMRLLIRKHGRVSMTERAVPTAFAAWADAFDRHHTRLPASWQHLSRSVRAAFGEVFGATTFIDIRPDVEAEPLAEPDFRLFGVVGG